MHAGPANFSFHRETFAEGFGDGASLAKSVRNAFRTGGGILGPLGRTRSRIDADHAVLAYAQIAQLAADAARFLDLREKAAAFGFVSHGRAAAGGAPDRSDERTGAQSF